MTTEDQAACIAAAVNAMKPALAKCNDLMNYDPADVRNATVPMDADLSGNKDKGRK